MQVGQTVTKPELLCCRSQAPWADQIALELVLEFRLRGWVLLDASDRVPRQTCKPFKSGDPKYFNFRSKSTKIELINFYVQCLVRFEDDHVWRGSVSQIQHFQIGNAYVILLGGHAKVPSAKPLKRLMVLEGDELNGPMDLHEPIAKRACASERQHPSMGSDNAQDGISCPGSSDGNGGSDAESSSSSSSSSTSSNESKKQPPREGNQTSNQGVGPVAGSWLESRSKIRIRYWIQAHTDGYQLLCREHNHRCSRALQLPKVDNNHDLCQAILCKWATDGACEVDKVSHKQMFHKILGARDSIDIGEVRDSWHSLGPL